MVNFSSFLFITHFHSFQLVGWSTTAPITEALSLTARLRVCFGWATVSWSVLSVGRWYKVKCAVSDSMDNGSVDENVVVYGRGSFEPGSTVRCEFAHHLTCVCFLRHNMSFLRESWSYIFTSADSHCLTNTSECGWSYTYKKRLVNL